MSPGWWTRAETVALRGLSFWRCIESEFSATALESGPNFLDGGRYSVAREFSALYLSGNRALARLEKTGGRDWYENLVDVQFRIADDFRVPDLTDARLQAKLAAESGIGVSELRAPGVLAYAKTRPVGAAAFAAGLPGLLVPSCHPAGKGQQRWNNLVLFPANLLSRWLIRA